MTRLTQSAVFAGMFETAKGPGGGCSIKAGKGAVANRFEAADTDWHVRLELGNVEFSDGKF